MLPLFSFLTHLTVIYSGILFSVSDFDAIYVWKITTQNSNLNNNFLILIFYTFTVHRIVGSLSRQGRARIFFFYMYVTTYQGPKATQGLGLLRVQ